MTPCPVLIQGLSFIIEMNVRLSIVGKGIGPVYALNTARSLTAINLTLHLIGGRWLWAIVNQNGSRISCGQEHVEVMVAVNREIPHIPIPRFNDRSVDCDQCSCR